VNRAYFLGLFLIILGCGPSGESGAQPAPAPTPPPSAPPANSDPVVLTWTITGTLPAGGTLNGTFSYIKDTTPSNTDLVPPTIDEPMNGTFYKLKDWHLSFTPTVLYPMIELSNVSTAQTAHVCVGSCVVMTPALQQLVFDNGLGQRVEVSFLKPDGTALPTDLAEWGPVYLPRSWLRYQFIPNVVNKFSEVVTVQLTQVEP